MELKIKLDAIPQEIKSKLQSIATDIVPKVAKIAGNILHKSALKTFSDPTYRIKEWAPLSEKTLERKNSRKNTEKNSKKNSRKTKAKTTQKSLLIDTGILFKSLKYSTQGNSIILKSSTPYAATHQFGRKFIQARPFFPIMENSEKLPPKIYNELKEEITEFIKSKYLNSQK